MAYPDTGSPLAEPDSSTWVTAGSATKAYVVWARGEAAWPTKWERR